MKILTCPKCQSQFDVATMQPGASFVCGKCRNVLAVPSSAPVVQPAPVVRPMAAPVVAPVPAGPPPTVVLSPDDMRRALSAARGQAAEPAPGKAAPKLPPAMEARRQQQATQPSARAGGPSTPAPAPIPTAAAPASARTASRAPAAAAAPAASASASRATAPAKSAAPAAAPVKAGPAKVAAAAAPAPVASGRPSRRARGGGGEDADDAAPEKKSQTGLYVGVGAGVLVVAIAAFAMMRKGGGGTEGGANAAGGTSATGTNGATGPAAATPVADGAKAAEAPVPANLDDWGRYLRAQESERKGLAAKRRADATGDAEKLKGAWDWFGDPRLASDRTAQDARKAIVEDALRVDANLEWANLAKGRKNVWDMLTATKKECEKAFKYPELDEREVEAALTKFDKDRWAESADYAKAEKVAQRVRDRSKALDSDARLVKVEDKKQFIRGNPAFKDFKFVYRWADPYLICQQYDEFTSADEQHKNKQRLEKVNLIANRDAIIFTELHKHFRELFAERFKLPELRDKQRILTSVITWNQPSFNAFYSANNNGGEPPGYVRAFYSPPEQKIFHYIGDDSLRAQDEFPVANGRVQKTSDQTTFHEGLHQLQHEYGAIFRGKPLVDDDKKVPPRKAMWFDEGMAEFMGSVEVDRDKKEDLVGATFFHNRLLGERINDIVGDGRGGANARDQAKKWKIAEFIQPNDNGELLNHGTKLGGHPVGMAVLFYSRSWAFVHFCWYYDNGKYRGNLLDYMETVLKEEHSPASLAKAFGRKDAKDWKGIEEEYEWYWDRCLARRFGWKDDGHTKPWNTETDVPEGKYDPNAKDE